MTTRFAVPPVRPEVDCYLPDLHNAYAGRVFVIGTGPSLNKVTNRQWDRLERECLFGVNTLLKYDRLPKIPELYAVAESTWLNTDTAITDIIPTLHGTPTVRIYAHVWPLPGLDDWRFVYQNRGAEMERGDFQGLGDKLPYVSAGQSVAMLAVQIAAWCGFTDIILLGTDATEYGHAKGLNDASLPADAIRERQDCFIRAAAHAEAVLGEHGRRLLNATHGGNLTVTRATLDEVLR